MISKVEIKNYKSFEKQSMELRNFNVLIGPNNSGKSNFCNALKLVHDLSIFPVKDVFSGRYNIDQLIRVFRQPSQISIMVSEKNEVYSYALSLTQVPQNELPDFDSEVIQRNGVTLAQRNPHEILTDGTRFNIKPNGSYIGRLEWFPDDSILKMGKSDFSRFLELIRSIAYYRFNPKSIHIPSAIIKEDVAAIQTDGSALPSVLHHILLYDRNMFGKIVTELSKNFNEVEDILLKSTEAPIFGQPSKDGFRIQFKMRNSEKILESPQISDGVCYFLLFLTIMNLPHKPSLIIIEEPENGIHPSNLKKIIEYLKQLSVENDCQIIMTTHSPYLLDWVDKKDVLIFHRENEGPTQITRMSEIPNFEEFSAGFTWGELWANYGEERLLKGKIDDED